ncbi:hypothetical protein ABIB17_001967 [Arthrobacter sp. UYEF6]
MTSSGISGRSRRFSVGVVSVIGFPVSFAWFSNKAGSARGRPRDGKQPRAAGVEWGRPGPGVRITRFKKPGAPSAHAGHIASLGRAHAVVPVDAHGVTAALLGGPLWRGGLPCGVTLPQGQPVPRFVSSAGCGFIPERH